MNTAVVILIVATAILCVVAAHLFLRLRREVARNAEEFQRNEKIEASLRLFIAVASRNKGGSGIDVPFHIFSVRDIVRTIAAEDRAVFDRRPDFVWRLRAIDEYLTAIGQELCVVDENGNSESRPCIPRIGTYEPLAAHLAEADI